MRDSCAVIRNTYADMRSLYAGMRSSYTHMRSSYTDMRSSYADMRSSCGQRKFLYTGRKNSCGLMRSSCGVRWRSCGPSGDGSRDIGRRNQRKQYPGGNTPCAVLCCAVLCCAVLCWAGNSRIVSIYPTLNAEGIMTWRGKKSSNCGGCFATRSPSLRRAGRRHHPGKSEARNPNAETMSKGPRAKSKRGCGLATDTH
jgi:hypothetical protein